MEKKIGEYEVLATLGKGAGSTIHKIRRKADARLYALKVIELHSGEDKKYLEQAAHEFEISKRLRHSSIRAVYAFERQHKLFRLSGALELMEFVNGAPLSALPSEPLLPLLIAFFKVADGLAYMHGRGYFHADIKPDNVLIATDGGVKIIDLGLVWQRGDEKDRVQGTLEFLAPEQAIQKVVNERTDIFNFGATMYRMLTSKPIPSQLRDPDAGAIKGVDDIVRPVTTFHAQVPEDLDELVRQCVRHDPCARPTSMTEIRDRLRKIGKRIKGESRGRSD